MSLVLGLGSLISSTLSSAEGVIRVESLIVGETYYTVGGVFRYNTERLEFYYNSVPISSDLISHARRRASVQYINAITGSVLQSIGENNENNLYDPSTGRVYSRVGSYLMRIGKDPVWQDLSIDPSISPYSFISYPETIPGIQ